MNEHDARMNAAQSFIESQKAGRRAGVWHFRVTQEYWTDTAIDHLSEIKRNVQEITAFFPGTWVITKWVEDDPDEFGIIEVRGQCIPQNYEVAMQEALRVIESSLP